MTARKMNRRTWLGAALAVAALTPTLFLTGCGGDDDDNDFILRSVLSAANEIPTPTGNPTVTGTGEVRINEDRTQLDVRIQTTGNFTSPVTAAHIHIINNPNGTGPVVIPLFNRTTDGEWNPQYHRILTEANFNSQQTAAASFQDAINKMLAGQGYINIHTVTNPAGEIRGNLVLHSQGSGF